MQSDTPPGSAFDPTLINLENLERNEISVEIRIRKNLNKLSIR